MFDFAENLYDRSRTAIELKLDQNSNQGWTFVADRVISNFIKPTRRWEFLHELMQPGICHFSLQTRVKFFFPSTRSIC
jgi:hypothetical protein